MRGSIYRDIRPKKITVRTLIEHAMPAQRTDNERVSSFGLAGAVLQTQRLSWAYGAPSFVSHRPGNQPVACAVFAVYTAVGARCLDA
ncbi:protein of unknown function [Pararobbsia alpina]